jgi:phospholipid/cholesterol/gamma-HCH transport system substrate-binding protein
MMTAAEGHDGGLSVRDQIERYRSSFIAVVTMIVIAAFVGGYILAHENLHLPGWVPVLGHEYFKLDADFQTAQAVTPGQGQAVTIAGAKIGEIAAVELHEGVARVSMNLDPKYADNRIFHNATLLLRPKTQLEDITLEINPGNPSTGALHSGETIPLSQTAPNIDFDEFLAAFDTETRAYLQLLLQGLGQGLNHNGRALSATFKRFDPTARLTEEIARELKLRHANTARAIHNFSLLIQALGTKDKQLAELVDASNAVFATFAKEEANFKSTLTLLPGALKKTGAGVAELGKASRLIGPTLHNLLPFARALGPANDATRKLAETTTPILKNQIRPFAREIEPVVAELGPSTKQLAEAFPKLTTSFAVFNEFFNELAYNPGPSKGGFLFFLDWANHNLNSVLSSSDATGPLGRSLIYFNCEVLPILAAAGEINKSVNLLVGLTRPATKAECINQGLTAASTATTSLRAGVKHGATGGLFSGLQMHPFGEAPAASPSPSQPTGAPAAAPPLAHSASAAGAGGGG